MFSVNPVLMYVKDKDKYSQFCYYACSLARIRYDWWRGGHGLNKANRRIRVFFCYVISAASVNI